MDKQEAVKQISELIKQAHEKIKQAEKISEESGIEFSFDVAYGMGGSYYPENYEYKDEYSSTGWVSSSANC